MLNLLNDILDFSKIEAGKLDLEEVDFELRDTICDALQTIAVKAAEKDIELACHVAPDVPDDLVGDPTRFRQVIVNLAGNGIKFTDDGEVVVEVRVGHVPRVPSSCSIPFAIPGSASRSTNRKESLIHSPRRHDHDSPLRWHWTGPDDLDESGQHDGRSMWVESEEGVGSVFRFTAEFGLGQPKKQPSSPGHLGMSRYWLSTTTRPIG